MDYCRTSDKYSRAVTILCDGFEFVEALRVARMSAAVLSAAASVSGGSSSGASSDSGSSIGSDSSDDDDDSGADEGGYSPFVQLDLNPDMDDESDDFEEVSGSDNSDSDS